MIAAGDHNETRRLANRWRAIAGVLAIAAGALWLLLTFPNQPCASCGATPEPATALAPGVVATMNSPVFAYSPGWQVSADGADPVEPADAFAEPAGVIAFTYTGDALWLLLAPGDYWAYLYATVDGQPANRLANIAGNRDSTGATAGYTTLLAPELAGEPAEDRLRWIEVHRASILQETRSALEGERGVRLEFWRGWGQTPLRAVAVDPPEDALQRPDVRRPLWNAPLWPGALLVLAGLWLAGGALIMNPRVRQVRTISSPKITWLHVSELATRRIGWSALAIGAALVAAGTASDRWLLALAGVGLLGVAGLLRPALWLAALLFALPFAYAVDLPLLPGRALGIVDVGVLGGAAVLAGHLAGRWLTGEERLSAASVFDRWQRVALILLALLVGWAFVASLDVRYPALALREWRVVFLYALIFAATLVGLLRSTRNPEADRWLMVAGWLIGATVVAASGLWGFASGQGFVSAAEGVRRVQALYDSANNLALYLDRTLAATLALAIFVRGRRQQALWAALAAVQGLAWLLTFSKGALLLAAPAMVLVLGGGGLWLLRQRNQSTKSLLLLVGIVVIGGLALTPFIGAERFQRLLDFEQGTGFLRLQLWRSSWQMALDHTLLGVGPDQFLYHYRSGYLLPAAWQEPNLNHPHNLLLDWWTRLGLVGLGLGMSWLGAGVWAIWRWLQRTAGHSPESALALGLLAATAAGLAHGLIDVGYALPELMLIWALSFHLCGSSAQEEPQTIPTTL
jgi:O-antigen ligase